MMANCLLSKLKIVKMDIHYKPNFKPLSLKEFIGADIEDS